VASVDGVASGSSERSPFLKRPATRAAGLFLAIWVVCFVYLAVGGGNFLFPISSLVLFGIILTGIAIFLTRKAAAPAVSVAKPKQESIVLLLYLVVYALLIFGPVSGLLRAAVPDPRAQELALLAYKLVAHLLIPILLLRAIGGHVRDVVDAGLGRRGVLLTLLLFSAFMIVVVALLNSIFEQLAGTGLSPAAVAVWIVVTWLWYSLEVGVTEEFLFRGLIQSRLTAWIGAAPMAIVATSILFALVHVPSLYLRGGEAVAAQAGDLSQVIALAIASLAPISIMIGTLWYRTRSFLLVVLVHGAIDTMPGVEQMIAIWG